MPDLISRTDLLAELEGYLSDITRKHANADRDDDAVVYRGMMLGITGAMNRVIEVEVDVPSPVFECLTCHDVGRTALGLCPDCETVPADWRGKCKGCRGLGVIGITRGHRLIDCQPCAGTGEAPPTTTDKD